MAQKNILRGSMYLQCFDQQQQQQSNFDIATPVNNH